MTAPEAKPRDAPGDLSGDPHVHLLFAALPYLRIARGDRLEYLRRAWIASARHHTAGFYPMQEGRLSTDPREAALNLLDAVIQVARTTGINGPDIVAHFNRMREAGDLNALTRSDEALERAIAALMVLASAKLQARRK